MIDDNVWKACEYCRYYSRLCRMHEDTYLDELDSVSKDICADPHCGFCEPERRKLELFKDRVVRYFRGAQTVSIPARSMSGKTASLISMGVPPLTAQESIMKRKKKKKISIFGPANLPPMPYQGFISATSAGMSELQTKLDTSEAKVVDLMTSIVEFKEFAEEQAAILKGHKMSEKWQEVVEHCLAVLEEHGE